MTRKESLKAYALANKEAISANKKRYYEANKEKIKAYREVNKEKIKAYRKEYYESLINDFYTMYYIPQHHYIGITNQPITRLRNHSTVGRITTDWEVVSTFKTKREALDAEKYMHSIGYCG